MARQFTQLKASVWSDREFCSLPAHAQRVYFLAKSQANVSWCGVVPYTEKRWAAMASDTTREQIADAVDVLVDRGYVILDEETEELWVRSWVKHNGVLEQPNLRKAMRAAYRAILSTAIRQAFYESLPESEKALVESPPEPLGNPSGGPAEADELPRCVGQDLDLDLQLQPAKGEAGRLGGFAQALAAHGCPPSFFDEVGPVLDTLRDQHPAPLVDDAVRSLILAGRRFTFASHVRKAVDAILADVAARPVVYEPLGCDDCDSGWVITDHGAAACSSCQPDRARESA